MNFVTRSIIEENRCLIYKKFDYKSRYCLDKKKKNFIYLEQREYTINLKNNHDHDHDKINNIFDENIHSKNNSLSISSSSRAKN